MAKVNQDGMKSFGTKIPAELKGQFDQVQQAADIHISRIVKQLAEFFAGMSTEEARAFCYGTGILKLKEYIAEQVKDQISLQWPPSISVDNLKARDAFDEAEAQCLAHKRKTSRKSSIAG